MAYFVTILITIFLALLEVSFLPHFKIFGFIPFVTLAFLAGIAVRYRGVFHILVAFAVGVFFAGLFGGNPIFFPLIFTLMVFFGKYFFYREASYNATQSFLILFVLSSTALFVANSLSLVFSQDISVKELLFNLIIFSSINLIFGIIIYKLFDRFYDWLNKKAEERYR